MDIPEVASAVGQVASALLAIPAAFVAYFAYKTSRSSAAAAAALTAIERTRLHGELRPILTGVASRPEKWSIPLISISLAGPPMLHRLDEIHIAIHRYREFRLAGGVVELDEQAPVRFRWSEGDDESPWSRVPFPLYQGERRGYAVEPNDSVRTDGYGRTLPLRLMVECRSADYEPWFIPLAIDAPANGWWEEERGNSGP